MKSLFGGGSTPVMSKAAPPPALPRSGSDAADQAMKAAQRRSGYGKTIITGDLTPKPTGKKKFLGE